MKKYYVLLLFLLFTVLNLTAQTTETFETETVDSFSFTDNGQVFNISTQIGPGSFNIYNSGGSNYGFNGTSADSRFIDNSGAPGPALNVPVQFTIASAGAAPFTLKKLYLYLSQYNADLAVSGTCTITGKLGGSTVYTATASLGFNTNINTQNGFTEINMTIYGGSNNSNTTIDTFVITTGGSFAYVAMDAMTWQTVALPTITTSATTLSNFTSCPGVSSASQSFTASGSALTGNITVTAPTGYEVSLSSGSGYGATVTLTQSGGTVATTTIYTRLASSVSGNPAGNIALTSSGATTKNVAVTGTVAAISGTTVVTNISCNGGTNGAINLTPTGGTGSYTYNWGGGITTEDRTGLAAGTYSVTITDTNSCTATVSSIVVGQPTALSGTTVVTNISCNGGANGAINLTPTGGTGSYTYNWVGGVTTQDRVLLTAGTYSVTITDANGCTATISSIVVGQPTALSGTTVVTNVSCNGGTNGAINLTPTGGTGPYTFDWGGSITTEDRTGLAAGTYSVTITDANSCTATVSSIVVGQPTALSGTTVVTNISCNGGTNGAINLTPTGGTGSYTFDWGGGITTEDRTGLAAGTYSVTITDTNSCTGTVSVTVNHPTLLVASQGTINNVSCNGGSNASATVVVTGGTTPYTYDWNGAPTGDGTATISGLAQGTYTVTVKDANLCETTQSFTITQPIALTATTSQTDVLCNGAATGIASVTVSGGTGGYTYLWAPSGGTGATATGLTAGTYTVTIKDANLCQKTQTFTINQPTALIASAGTITHVNCRGEATGAATVSATGGTGTYTYSWTPSGGTAATATGLTAGTYIVTVKDANLCQTTQSFTINQPAAILSATSSSTGVSCNGGSNGFASVTVSGGTSGYTYLWAPSGGTGSAATGLAAGSYTCTITDANGCTLVKNITISTPAPFSRTMSKTDVSCNGGTNGAATITVSGATSPYTYSWSPSGGNAATASGLAAGTYTVTVSDANTCMDIQSVTINQPSVLTATTAKTDVLCNGQANGTAMVSVSGGTPGYTYVWTPSGGTAATATGLATGNYTCTTTDANGCIIAKSFTINQPTALTATTSQVNATCSSTGQAGVTPSGGTTPYTYLWSPSGGTAATATGLAAGNYNCVITDANGCSITKNFTITSTNTLVATTAKTDILCNGANTGSATVTPSGATGPYTYVWVPSGGTGATASNLTAGNYSVTITSSNGCSIVKNFIITEPPAMTITPSQNNVTCNGGANASATVSVTGGTGPYTYTWSPSGGTAATATGLSAGTYTVVIQNDNLCEKTQSFTITEPAALVASTGAQTNVSCNGGTNGSATVNVTGGIGAYTYLWTPSGGTAATASGLAAGTYTVTVKDANLCPTTQSFTITEPVVLTATTSQTNVSCNGQANGTATVSISGGTPGYTYSWTPFGGTAATATGLSTGNYTCTITDANGCSLTKNFTITEPTLLSATTAQTNLSCNDGSNGIASVTVSGGVASYTYVWSSSANTNATETGLSAGNHTCTITDANGCTLVKNFTLTQPVAITATTSQTNATCNGVSDGTAGVIVTGGTGSYTYTWSPSGGTAATATGLAAGNYTCTITDANACSFTKNFTITESTALVAITAQTNVSCFGGFNGTAGVTVTGGSGVYSYLWSPSGGTAATASGLTAGNYNVIISDTNGCSITKNFTITEPTLLSATSSQTNLLCNGGNSGSATVIVAGGTAPYTYLWSPSGGTGTSATGLAAGTYTCTITDANLCQITQNFTITTPPALTITSSQTNLLCFGASTGSATVMVSGGTPGYTYTWAPSGGTAATATELAAGNYTCTITDANGCTATQTFTITAPPAFTATTTQTNILCFGAGTGSATITVSGGTPGYTYAWAPSGGTAATATGLAAGNYTCTITDGNGCTLTKPVTILQQPVLTVNGSSTNVTCNGAANGTAGVSVSGGTPGYTYLWAPSGGTGTSATGLTAGTYTCTVTDANGCTKIRTFTISEQTPISITSVKTDLLCQGATNGSATVTATGGVPNYTYTWSTGAGGSTALGLSAGTYTVTATDALGCSVVHNITISAPDALTVGITQNNITCYGNNDGSLALNVSGGTAPYTYAWTPALGTGSSITGLEVGNYSVVITDANGCTTLRNFSLTQPSQLTASLTKTNVSCYGNNDGTAIAAVSGGTPPYTYSWTSSGGGTPDPENLVSGTYNVTITDANNCTFTGSVTITQPLQSIVISHPQNVTTTTNGNATYAVNATNITNYQWQFSADGTNWNDVINGGANPAYTGANTNSLTITGAPSDHNGYLYRVMLKNGINCVILSNTASLTIENVLEAIDDDFSETVIFAGTGGIAGDVTANDLYNNLPVYDTDVTIAVINNDGLFGVAIDNDGNLIIPPTTTIGTYTITYSICEAAVPTNCSTAQVEVVVSDVTGIADIRNLTLSIYPNPAATEIFIKIPDFSAHKNIKVSIHDLNGRLIKENYITSELQRIEVTGLESGMYIFKITSDTAQTSKRIIVDKKF